MSEVNIEIEATCGCKVLITNGLIQKDTVFLCETHDGWANRHVPGIILLDQQEQIHNLCKHHPDYRTPDWLKKYGEPEEPKLDKAVPS